MRLINEQGKSVFVKFHWKPCQGLNSLEWVIEKFIKMYQN
jgi:catalase